jgi:hypothetical protein
MALTLILVSCDRLAIALELLGLKPVLKCFCALGLGFKWKEEWSFPGMNCLVNRKRALVGFDC